MKTRQIAKHLDSKLSKWIESVNLLETRVKKLRPDETVFSLGERLRDKVMISGGAIVSYLRDEEPNDFDVYVTDMELAKELAKLYLDGYVKGEHGVEVVVRDDATGVKYFFDPLTQPFKFLANNKESKKKFVPHHITENAITLTDGVQIILRFVGEPSDVHKNFDFVHCTNYYTFNEGLCLNLPAMTSIMTKELRYNGSLYPVAAYFRLRKFLERGWYINAAEMFKIAFDINQLDLKDRHVLSSQLIGVDEMYFTNVIDKLFGKSGEEFERSTLFKILDLAFDSEEKDKQAGESSHW